MEDTDVLVAGGGIAGRTAAARFAAAGLSVVLADPAPSASAGDLRTTAFLSPAIRTLERAGAWEAMLPDSAMLRTMRLVDAGGRERAPRLTTDFRAAEIGEDGFGRNVPNRSIQAALSSTLDAFAQVTRIGSSVTGYVGREDAALIRLADGRTLHARLVVAADGRNSTLRGLAGIRHRRWEYHQQALVFAVTHEAPHEGVSTEIHRTGGPLTLVPMADHAGAPCSSVVWMVPNARAARLSALDDAALATELTAETMGLFGPLTIAGPRAVWPIIGQMALDVTAPRLALVAEAAHVIPPIGAQGLNMSLADVETLAGLAEEARSRDRDIGSPELLARYKARRMPEMLARVAGVDMLNRAAQTELQPLRDLRAAGLAALHGITPVRRLAMRLGLGAW